MQRSIFKDHYNIIIKLGWTICIWGVKQDFPFWILEVSFADGEFLSIFISIASIPMEEEEALVKVFFMLVSILNSIENWRGFFFLWELINFLAYIFCIKSEIKRRRGSLLWAARTVIPTHKWMYIIPTKFRYVFCVGIMSNYGYVFNMILLEKNTTTATNLVCI